MNVFFRTDASIIIGTGHVMRCLTLAEVMREEGMNCQFICREHDGNLLNEIQLRGFKTHALPIPQRKNNVDTNTDIDFSYSSWLGVGWEEDARQTEAILSKKLVNWLIVDHYALDVDWEQYLRPRCDKIMVIDDLANRMHDCDMLLDQNLGRTINDYEKLIPNTIKILIGPKYALLRPEFYKWRGKSLNRRGKNSISKLIISMGGVDKDNSTNEVLKALGNCNLHREISIKVILGSNAPWLKVVKARLESMAYNYELLINVNNMARIMSDADIAIGSPGSTSWERCCLGLPSFLVIIADNQISIGKALESYGAAVLIGDINNVTTRLPKYLERHLKNPKLIDEMSRNAANICDGFGTKRTITEMASN